MNIELVKKASQLKLKKQQLNNWHTKKAKKQNEKAP